VRRIFNLHIECRGYSRMAKRLNAEGAPAPKPYVGRPAGWAPSSISEVLRRSLYRGDVIWNRTRKRDRWGQVNRSRRPESDRLARHEEALRIVPEAQWQAAQARLRAARLSTSAGPRCAATVCVCRWTLTGDVLRPAVVMAILDGVLEAQRPRQGQNPLEEARRALHRLEREIARLTEAIAAGGTLASLLKALRDREVNRWHDPHDRSSRGRTSALAGSARLAAQICARGPNVPLRGAGVVQKSARRNSRVSN